jgi:ketosteroid isomerase-like protein
MTANIDAKSLVNEFYDAFSRRQGPQMATFYADDAEFSDEVFTDLKGKEIGAMWTMLCSRANDLAISYQITSATDDTVCVDWSARYTFTKTKRSILNNIKATIRVRDGKIIFHKDQFDTWRWSRQAFGLPGLMFGWSPFLINRVRKQARQSLDHFMATSQKSSPQSTQG